MDPSRTESSDGDDIKELLKCILKELRGNKTSVSRQSDQFQELSMTLADLVECGVDRPSKPKLRSSSLYDSRRSVLDYGPSIETRTGPILKEAISRYHKNSIPTWSPLYGTHLARYEVLITPEVTLRNTEWSSITGDCWKIPHDNRVTFCFLAPLSDIAIVAQVRNFISHFHTLSNPDILKGEYFNVWDWFDMGISAYWCPGSKSPLSQVFFDESTVAQSKLESNTLTRISHLVAPWRRIINFKGLTTISNRKHQITRDELTDRDLCPFFCPESPESIFQQPIDEMLWRAVKCHLSCTRTLDAHQDELQTKDCIMFHITFFELLNQTTMEDLIELWPCGDLHSDGQQDGRKPRKIRESALTLFSIPCSDMSGPKGAAIFWTLVCLRPSQFPHPHYSEKRDDLFRGRTHRMIDGMVDVAHQGLLEIVSRWEEIAAYFDELLIEKSGLLNPEYHDSLLTDDGVLSRSKKYFWAIDFLTEAGKSITDNLIQVERLARQIKSMPPLGDREHKEFELRLKKIETIIQKLYMLKLIFKNKKDEATALRDGLFSASAVMESRAATQQGENIKLLTLVNIFFLPLFFCSSLWSINNTLFSLSTLAVVMPTFGICTYIIVFYLSTIASCFSSAKWSNLIQQFADSRTKDMSNDMGPDWRGRCASANNDRRSQDGAGRLSYWQILQFMVRKIWLGTWHTIQGLRRGTAPEKYPEQNLGDIRVQVNVDVHTP